MRRLAICRGAPPRCLKKPIDGLGYSPYIAIARIFKTSAARQGAPLFGGLRGPAVSKGTPFALDEWPRLDQEDPAGDRVLIGALNASKELRSLQGASYVGTPRKFAAATPHRRSKDFSWSQGTTVILVKPFVGLKGPLLGSWGSLSNNEIFR